MLQAILHLEAKMGKKGKNMKKIVLILLVLALILGAMPAFGHRMFIGQRMTVDLTAIYDDGEPASDATVQIFRDGDLYAENRTDSAGRFSMVLPGKGTGDWKYLVSGGGHEESATISIKNEATTATAAAALALIVVPAAWMWRRRSGR